LSEEEQAKLTAKHTIFGLTFRILVIILQLRGYKHPGVAKGYDLSKF
jgi:hypothetical protein